MGEAHGLLKNVKYSIKLFNEIVKLFNEIMRLFNKF